MCVYVLLGQVCFPISLPKYFPFKKIYLTRVSIFQNKKILLHITYFALIKSKILFPRRVTFHVTYDSTYDLLCHSNHER